nr:hypothetical protein [Tanacetum cinerariifolium]
MRPFGCFVTILNTLDPLGKFKGKVDEGFLVGYFVCSKAFRVFNSRIRIIQETLHVNFLENKPNVAGTGPTWLFDINSLSGTMNYYPETVGNQTNSGTGFQDNFDAEKEGEEVDQSYMLFPVWSSIGSINPQNNAEDAAFNGKEHDFDVKKLESKVILSPSSSAQSKEQDDKIMKEATGKSLVESVIGYRDLNAEFQDCTENNSNEIPTVSSTGPTVGQNSLNRTNTFSAAEADFNNLESSIPVSPIPTTRIHKDHPVSQIITPRAWYETLATYLLENGFQRGIIDQNLFIKKQKGDILLVQIYVDDIIFGVTNKDLCRSFEKLMKDKFQKSSMGELTFFLEGKSASTSIDTEKPLLKDPDGEDVDVHTYRSMIGSLMYLTSSRPYIMFTVCCKKQTVVATSSTKAEYVAAASCCAQLNDITRLQALVDRKKVVLTETVIRDVLRLDDAEGVDCLSNEEIFTELARMGYEKPSTKLTFYKAFFSSQWIFLIHTILQSMSAKHTSWNEFSSAMASIVICLSTGENVEEGIAAEQVQDDVVVAATQEGITAAIEEDVREQSIPLPTLPPYSPQDRPSTSSVQPTPPPSPQPQPQATDFPFGLLQTALDTCAALSSR